MLQERTSMLSKSITILIILSYYIDNIVNSRSLYYVLYKSWEKPIKA